MDFRFIVDQTQGKTAFRVENDDFLAKCLKFFIIGAQFSFQVDLWGIRSAPKPSLKGRACILP